MTIQEGGFVNPNACQGIQEMDRGPEAGGEQRKIRVCAVHLLTVLGDLSQHDLLLTGLRSV